MANNIPITDSLLADLGSLNSSEVNPELFSLASLLANARCVEGSAEPKAGASQEVVPLAQAGVECSPPSHCRAPLRDPFHSNPVVLQRLRALTALPVLQ